MKPNKAKEESLSCEELKRLLSYDNNTGIFTWSPLLYGKTGWCSKMKGTAGSAKKDGYIEITLHRRAYKAHRLAWLYVYGRWPEYQIDHINLNKSDNRIENLREATVAENTRNQLKGPRNTSGFKGVVWHRKDKVWRASVSVNKKRHHLGSFDTPEEASAAYEAKAKELFGEFYRAPNCQS